MVITPLGQTWNEFFQQWPHPPDDFFAERRIQAQADQQAF